MPVLKSLTMMCYGYAIFLFYQKNFVSKYRPALTAGIFILYEWLFDYYLLGHLVSNYFLSVSLSQIGLVLLTVLLWKEPFFNKITLSVIIFTIQELISYCVESLLSLCFFAVSDAKGILYPVWVYQGTGLLRYFACGSFLVFLSRRYNNFGNIPMKKMIILLLLPFLFIIIALESSFYVFYDAHIIQVLHYLRFGWNDKELYFYCADIGILLLISSMGLLTSLSILFYASRSVRQDFIQRQQASQISYYKKVQQQQKHLLSFKHDIKNHNIALQSLAGAGKLEELKSYLNAITETSGISNPEIHTGNGIADAILTEKITASQKNGISFLWDAVFPPDGFISDYDLCVILGNALDNALESCSKCKEKQPFIRLEGRTVKTYFLLEIQNSIVPNPDKPFFHTSKPNPEFHGFGLKQIQDAVKKNHGEWDISIKKGVFSLSLMLPL